LAVAPAAAAGGETIAAGAAATGAAAGEDINEAGDAAGDGAMSNRDACCACGAGAADAPPIGMMPVAAAGGGAKIGAVVRPFCDAVLAVVMPANMSSADAAEEDEAGVGGFATAAGDSPKMSRSPADDEDDVVTDFAVAVGLVCMPLKMSRSLPAAGFDALLLGAGARLTPPGPVSVSGPRSARGASPATEGSSELPKFTPPDGFAAGTLNSRSGSNVSPPAALDEPLLVAAALGEIVDVAACGEVIDGMVCAGACFAGAAAAAAVGVLLAGETFAGAAALTFISANMSSGEAPPVVEALRAAGGLLELVEDNGAAALSDMPAKAAESAAPEAGLGDSFGDIFSKMSSPDFLRPVAAAKDVAADTAEGGGGT